MESQDKDGRAPSPGRASRGRCCFPSPSWLDSCAARSFFFFNHPPPKRPQLCISWPILDRLCCLLSLWRCSDGVSFQFRECICFQYAPPSRVRRAESASLHRRGLPTRRCAACTHVTLLRQRFPLEKVVGWSQDQPIPPDQPK